jgi:transglutaminase-like putative cysteine protease
LRFYQEKAKKFQEIANWITQMYLSTYDRIAAATNYILKTPETPDGLIEYVPDIVQPECGRLDCKKSPLVAIQEGVGDCEEIGAAVASTLKAMGVPSQVVSYGEMWDGERWAGHVWVEAWDDSNFYVIETTTPEIFVFKLDENPYDTLTEYRPINYVRGY